MSAAASNPPPEPLPARRSESTKGTPGATREPNGGPRYVVLTGNPNCGKTTLFNSLTGLRAKVGNYAGVTVERKEGRLLQVPANLHARALDLPGTYSLSPQSLDEQVSRDVLLNRLPELPPPALIIVVVDASNLQRNLYYATQVVELAHPTLIALNMVDVAEANGIQVDTAKLAEALGVPVIPVVASSGRGLPELRRLIISSLEAPPVRSPQRFCDLPPALAREVDALGGLLASTFHHRQQQAACEALLILSNDKALASSRGHYPAGIEAAVTASRGRLETENIDWRAAPIEARYDAVSRIQQTASTDLGSTGETFSDRLDRVLTHKVWGTLLFFGVMALMFQSIFSFAHFPMEALQTLVDWLGRTVAGVLPAGELNNLVVNGVIAGVGAVVVFLPQILLLFLFIGFLEDTGYMARAAFLMDRVMSKVGLHGKSFIPMISSFACAIPGIMATRTIESPKDRLATILVAPLMTCSARFQVYMLLIPACIPDRTIAFGLFKLSAVTLLAMYLLGVVVALIMAWLFKHTLLKGAPPMLILELPPYKRPLLRVVARHMWDRSRVFLRQAGTVILGINILLWFLATYPHRQALERDFATRRAALVKTAEVNAGRRVGTERVVALATGAAGAGLFPFGVAAGIEKSASLAALDKELAGERLRQSFAGHLGRALEPVIAPLGFDWKIGIGIVSSFAAREVFVSTMSTVYNVGSGEGEGGVHALASTLQAQTREDGTPLYTPLTGVTLMVFFVFALQCASTVAIVRRETNSWKWPVFQWLYMGALAWGFAFLTFRVGHALGFR